MLIKDNEVVVTKVGDLLKIDYNKAHSLRVKYVKNLITDNYVILLKEDKGVRTNMLCNEPDTYTHTMFYTINGVTVSDNDILFDELEKLL